MVTWGLLGPSHDTGGNCHLELGLSYALPSARVTLSLGPGEGCRPASSPWEPSSTLAVARTDGGMGQSRVWDGQGRPCPLASPPCWFTSPSLPVAFHCSPAQPSPGTAAVRCLEGGQQGASSCQGDTLGSFGMSPCRCPLPPPVPPPVPLPAPAAPARAPCPARARSPWMCR